MRIFVTGGTGYIGSALCRRLVGEGHELRALVRPTSERRELEELGVSCFVGDVTDRESMREPIRNTDWMIHAAAELDFGSPRERMRQANEVGSETVASVALESAGVRVLHVSSIAVFGGSVAGGAASTESSDPLLPLPNRYCITKAAAESAFRQRAEEGLPLNIVYPSLVYGPPSKKGGINSFLRLLLAGHLPVLVGADRISTWVYLDDVVEGIVRVMNRSQPGEHFLLTGESASTEAVVDKVCALAETRRPRFKVPVAAARLLVFGLMPFELVTGRRLPFNNQQLKTLARHWNFDDGKARRRLGWNPRGLDSGLPPTVDFLLDTLRK